MSAIWMSGHIAVNTALALQQNHGQTVLVDFALIGHAALHLNLRPKFSLLDALQNLHRMDATLLDELIASDENGLDLLAGSLQPYETAATRAELARLFHLLADQYSYVVIDCSSRIDATTKLLADLSNKVLLVGQPDVASLWSASRIRKFLHESLGRNQLQIVLNRYRKLPGFMEGDIENITGCEVCQFPGSKFFDRISNTMGRSGLSSIFSITVV